MQQTDEACSSETSADYSENCRLDHGCEDQIICLSRLKSGGKRCLGCKI
jgi:hypothetical protein